jgi:MFS transporter, YNFM family, putative membrane transport protein
MIIVLFATVLALSALYAPQPLLPLIVAEFGVNREAAAFLTTVSFIPLSIAPLFYGYLLESVAPRRMLRSAVLLLALSEVAFFAATSFPLLVAIRFFQGLLIPAMLTALMTYISRENDGAGVSRAIAIYVAATILGGFLGRAGSGLIASLFGWRASFLVLAASLLLCFFLLKRLKAQVPMNLAKPSPRLLLEIVRRPFFLRMYLVVFCLFFIFAAVMNFIPFRLTEISEGADAFRIGMVYSGYLMGIVASLGAARLARRLGGEHRVLLLGLSLFALALLGLAAPLPELLFLDMFLFCAAMFLVHATASGLVNQRARDNKGVVNGLYVSFYYAGGTFGSILPGFAYRAFGWEAFLFVLLVVAVSALILVGVKQKATGETIDSQTP